MDSKSYMALELLLLRFFDPSNGLRDSQGGFCQKMEFSTSRPLLGSKTFRIRTPQKLRLLMQSKVLEAQKNFRRPQRMKKKQFFSKTAQLFFPLTNLISVNLMGTYCTGICLGNSLLIFQFTRRGVHNNKSKVILNWKH